MNIVNKISAVASESGIESEFKDQLLAVAHEAAQALRNAEYAREAFRKEIIETAQRAAAEINSLRAQIGKIAPRAEAFDALQQVLDMVPKRSQGMSEDVAWMLMKRAQELAVTD